MDLIPRNSEKIEKMNFQYFPKVSHFVSHFSQILWLEISSNPGTFLSMIKIEFYVNF